MLKKFQLESGLSMTQVYPNPQRVSSQDRPINLASAVRVSIDTALQSCEVRKSVKMVTRAQELMGASCGSTGVTAGGGRQLQALVVAFIDGTWLGSLEGGHGSVNP